MIGMGILKGMAVTLRNFAGSSFDLRACPAVILSQHQSAWETLAFTQIFPPQVHVLKRELLWIPFFGWGLALMSPIPIDRARGVSALRSIARRGRERLDQGFWVVVFPEGTRVAPGERRTYQLGGAWLAAASGAPIVPRSEERRVGEECR